MNSILSSHYSPSTSTFSHDGPRRGHCSLWQCLKIATVALAVFFSSQSATAATPWRSCHEVCSSLDMINKGRLRVGDPESIYNGLYKHPLQYMTNNTHALSLYNNEGIYWGEYMPRRYQFDTGLCLCAKK